MFQNRSTSRSKASPFTPQGNQTRRISGLFTPQSSKRSSLHSSRSQVNRTLQTTQVQEESLQLRLDSYGLPLPVLITEALTSADYTTKVTVKIDPSGWAWLVGGRKLFVWRFNQYQSGKGIQCKELILPPSDLAHDAARVCVIPGQNEMQPAACVAVSPEGVVRYWPNIAYESSSIELSAELKGEECACVINFQPYGYLLGTTTSSLVLLTPTQNSITCHPLKGSQGMFAGISRRMSSFIFGAAPTVAGGAALQAMIPGEEEEYSRSFYLLSGTYLQKWSIGDGNIEKLQYQLDVDRMFRECIARRVWDKDSTHLPQLKTWLIDMQSSRDGIVLLGAAVNSEVSSSVHYAAATVPTLTEEAPAAFDYFTVLDIVESYDSDNEQDLLKYHLLIADPRANLAYIYDSRQIIISTVISSQNIERVDLPNPQDQILGAGYCENTAVFFSYQHGLFHIISPQNRDISIIEESMQDVTGVLSRAEVSTLAASSTQIHEMSLSDDRLSRLKACFLYSLQGQSVKAQSILEDLFQISGKNQSTDLDKLTIHLSQALIDDFPASDPRWAESLRHDSTSSSGSVIILQQLKDKQRAHDYLIGFLKKMNLWDKLGNQKTGDVVSSTRLLLCESAEKLQAAIVLREIHGQFSNIVDATIMKTLENRGNVTVPSGLTSQDVFYREISLLQDFVDSLLDYESECLISDLSSKEVVMLICGVNQILEVMFQEALQYRQSKAMDYVSETEDCEDPEYIPWTSTRGSKGIRTLLIKQYNITVDQAASEVKDAETKGTIFQQLLSLADIVLDGYSCQIESVIRTRGQDEYCEQIRKKYEMDRQNLLMPFLEHEQYEKGASIAEKYFDFEVLIQICEATENQERLQQYMQKFNDRGFSEYLFNWYMRQGKRGKLLTMPLRQKEDLGQYLQGEDKKYLSWLHDIQMNDFNSAHRTLLDLGKQEIASLSKKKTLLSLSKLAALATDPDPPDVNHNIKVISDEHDLIEYQELLPPDVLQDIGMDAQNMRVLSPEEIIELYIGEQNVSASEFDFKKALDLLHYVHADEDHNVEALRLHIWCRAILRDNWTICTTDDPLAKNRDTIFFKTINLVYTDGELLNEILPRLEDLLTSPEIGDLKQNRNFQFLMRAGYEQIESVIS